MGKSPLQSKTIKFHMLMVILQSISGSMAMISPFIEPSQFVIASVVLGIAQSMGGVYLRFITEEPLV